ncbi:MAG: InlB B-repeat-containing protein [Clostridia bacterium]|nr:InlB B-repeat-containing protein [Clostridia bacterium]
MKNKAARIISMLMAVIMVAGMIPFSVFAADTSLTVNVEAVNAMPGETVEVDITLADNPGISSLRMNVRYGDILTLTKVTYNKDFGGQFVNPQTLTSPVTLYWLDYSSSCDIDGVFATLTFVVSDSAKADEVANITVTYDPDDIYDFNMDNVDTVVNPGSVTVLPCVAGDINSDGKSNNKDATTLARFLAEWQVDINAHCIDVNGDGKVNNKDLTRLFQYLANWDVEVWCKCGVTKRCIHEMTEYPAKDANCTEDGNINYWYCNLCEKYFLDADGAAQTTYDAVVIAAYGHTVVIDEAVAPTYTTTGLTEGSHCSACGEVFVKQEIIPVLNGYSITYNVAGNDTYLAQQNIVNPNPTSYNPESSTIYVEDLVAPAGYTFLGWYDASGNNNITEIPKGSTGNKTLYAHWRIEQYEIQYESTLISDDGNKFETPSTTYTVNKDWLLPTPELDGYIFAGWSDEDGNVHKKITSGTTGHKIFKANWLSERNQAWAKHDYGEPVIHEDMNQILFAYEIGEIRNVPVYEIIDFGKINEDGVSKTESVKYSLTTSKDEMESYTDTVAKATTESFGWTLSSEWSDKVSVDESWAQENGMEIGEVESVCTNEASNWYISSGSYGTDTTVQLDTKDTYDLKTTTKNTKTYNTKETEKRQDFSAGLNLYTKSTLGINAKISDGLGINAGKEWGGALDLKYSQGKTTTKKTGKEKDSGSSEQTGSLTHTGTTTTNESGWNSESGYSGSTSVSQENSISQVLSEKISQSTNYGKEYINTEGESTNQDFVNESSNTNEYSSVVTYNTTVYEEKTESFTTENTRRGYHRWVMAGTAHVFGVVGYDIENSTYYTYTLSVMDDELFRYEDYSFVSSDYNDNQSSVIDFEAPIEILDYVADRVYGTEGLEVDANGTITGYEGTEKTVIIPDYMVTSGTNKVVKITAISADAFQNNTELEVIELSDFITSIPEKAFAGCTSLVSIEADSVTSIGAFAFSGCTALKYGKVGDKITSLGESVFDGLDSIEVTATNKKIIEAAIKSGTKEIYITVSNTCNDLTNVVLDIPEGTELFYFDGKGKEFSNVIINSNAETTRIIGTTLTSDSKTPLKVSKSNLVLQEVTLNAPAIALSCTADNTVISLYGESYVNTLRDNAMLCKNITLEKLVLPTGAYYSHLHINGNLLVYGDEPENTLMTVHEPGGIVLIDKDMFDKHLLGEIKIEFNTNGGTGEFEDKTIYLGDTYGELPIPTRDYYTFNGWYTEAEGGELITADMQPETVVNVTLYAHWTLNSVSGWVKVSDGIPEGAEIIETQWKYTLREYTTNAASSLSGWTKYDSKITSWSDWSSWSKTAATASTSKQVETKTVTDKAGYNQYRYWIYRSADHYYMGTEGYAGVCWNYEELYLTYPLELVDSANGLYGYHGCEHYSWANKWFFGECTWIPPVTHTEYRYRNAIYTYYYYRDLHNQISATDPTGQSNVSNVVKYVKYRAK